MHNLIGNGGAVSIRPSAALKDRAISSTWEGSRAPRSI